jgi:hypothetical protein
MHFVPCNTCNCHIGQHKVCLYMLLSATVTNHHLNFHACERNKIFHIFNLCNQSCLYIYINASSQPAIFTYIISLSLSLSLSLSTMGRKMCILMFSVVMMLQYLLVENHVSYILRALDLSLFHTCFQNLVVNLLVFVFSFYFGK